VKAYICDSCKTPITDPYDTKMKEFYVGVTFDTIPAPVNTTRKIRVHLCNTCYNSLADIAKKKAGDPK